MGWRRTKLAGVASADPPAVTPLGAVRKRLALLPPDVQRSLAVRLARLTLPLAALTSEAQPAGGLAAIAEHIRTDAGLVKIDAARHTLYGLPELLEDDEPQGAAWYTFGACIAWIYAADALTTASTDGVVNALSRVADLLDAMDSDLGDTALHEGLVAAFDHAVPSSEDFSSLKRDVEASVHRLQAVLQTSSN